MEEHGASCPARRHITHTSHTSMNYKYCLVCACQGMTSQLQSKVPSQNSCATGLDVPFWYTLFKVSAQLVCSWLSYSMQECELLVHQLHNICSKHSFVVVDVDLTTPKGVHWRKSSRKSPVSGPILEGHMASCPAQGQITHTDHTSLNYKYCLVYICQGMTSRLQSKVPPQKSCATGLGVPFQYTLFKVSAQHVCSWFP